MERKPNLAAENMCLKCGTPLIAHNDWLLCSKCTKAMEEAQKNIIPNAGDIEKYGKKSVRHMCLGGKRYTLVRVE